MRGTVPWESWQKLGASVAGKGSWHGGIIAVVNVVSGRAYFVATRNVGKRLWDQRDRLAKGTHPCPTLRADWQAHPNEFEFYLVETVKVPWLLNDLKQYWINKFGSEGQCYNTKAAVDRKRRRRQPDIPPIVVTLTDDGAVIEVQHEPERVEQLLAQCFAKLEVDLARVRPRDPERARQRAARLIRRAKNLLAEM